MSPIGGGKPLFDLISSGKRPGDARPKGGGPAHRDDRDGHDMAGRSVTVPMVWIYAGAGLLLILIIGGYGIGFRLGTGSAHETERRAAARDAQSVFVEDPLRSSEQPGRRAGAGDGTGDLDVGRPGDRSGDRSGDRISDRTGSGTGSGTPPSRSIGVLLADGRPGPDPRREGVNYLELVTLPRDQAIASVRYLSENGQEAIAVPVSELDPGRRRSNTSDSFRVIALGLAVPGDRFRSSTDARKRFEDRLRRLGKAWADEGGVSDFSDPLWRRFDG